MIPSSSGPPDSAGLELEQRVEEKVTGSRQTDTSPEGLSAEVLTAVELSAELRRLVSDIPPILETDPHRALNLARQAAKWILRDLFRQAYRGTAGGAAGDLRYGDLLRLLVSADAVPRRIQVQFQAIETFGTAEDHSDSGLTRTDVLPCLQALDTIVRWYLQDHLGSRERITLLPESDVASSSGARRLPGATRRRRRPPWRSVTRRGPLTLWRALAGLVSLMVVGVFLLQLLEVEIAASRRMGFVLDESRDGVRLVEFLPEGPAALGGLSEGDLLLAVDGRPIAGSEDYDIVAEGFVRDVVVSFRVRRGEEILDLGVIPGVPADWVQPLVRGAVMLLCLILAALTIYRGPGDLRGRLLGIFLFLLAIELSLPEIVIGQVWLQIALMVYFYLSTGFQIGIELHIASVIPERQRWLARRPWAVPLFYAVSLGAGAIAAATYLLESVPRYRGQADRWLPWSTIEIDWLLYAVGFPLWALAVLALLGYPSWRYPEPQGRLQARLVFLGFVPWSIYAFAVSVFTLLDQPFPESVDPLATLMFLPFPLSVWAMMELDSRNHRRILLTLAQKIRQLDSVEEISKQIAEDLDTAFHPTNTYVFFQQEHTDEMSLGHSTGAHAEVRRVPAGFELLEIAERSAEALVFPEHLEMLPAEEARWLERLETRLVVPLNDSRRGLVGLLMLGAKRSEEAYSARDFKLLHSLAGQIALSFENLGLQSRLHEKDRVQREVLARLVEQDINLVKECPSCGRCYDSAEEACADDGTELALSVPVERTVRGRYRLDRVLGKGGIGAVYEAFDQRLNRRVAVKVLLGAMLDKPQVQLRFEREARVIAQLSHPNIVTVYDFGQTAVGNAFIVLELLRGMTLRSRLRRSGALPPPTVADWLDPALEGLKAAHRKGVIHRDLKPGNVFLVTNARGEKVVKLLDFGIAKIKTRGTETRHLTVPGVMLGTLGYMAPEQVLGGEVDERADIYSIGVLVTEALLGHRPFKGRTPMEVLTSLSEVRLELPCDTPAAAELSRILRRCLRRDPGERFRSARRLQKVLIPALRACPGLVATEAGERSSDDPTLALGGPAAARGPEGTEEI